jgi:aspartyl-tRNA(Asn)/glutamyl-tRNA(Gln) amidotransferase subunit A
VKDSLYTVDLPTTWGSPALRDARSRPGRARGGAGRAAGALIIGKTNVPEFALEGYTANRSSASRAIPGTRRSRRAAPAAARSRRWRRASRRWRSARTAAARSAGRLRTRAGGPQASLSAVPREHVLPSLLLDFEVIGPLARTWPTRGCCST